jgi:Transglutaminase-like superfamily
MPRLRKVLALSAFDVLLIFQAILWFAVVEFGLRFLSLRTLLAILHVEKRSARNSHSEPPLVAFGTPERVAYCVELASRLRPLNATCLKKALVLYSLLHRRGFDAQMLIGVARDGGRLGAHAWLESQGRIILGAPTPGRYSTLCTLESSLAGTHQHEQATS